MTLILWSEESKLLKEANKKQLTNKNLRLARRRFAQLYLN